MTRLTIVLPVAAADSVTAFEETLASALEYQTALCDILVLHSPAYDDPWNTREDGVWFERCSHTMRLAAMVNEALAMARGDVILVLSPGTELSHAVIESALDAFATRLKLGWLAPTLVTAEHPQRIASTGFAYRPHIGTLRPERHETDLAATLATLVPHTAAAYFRRQALLEAGGFDATLSLQMSYADAAVRMTRLGWSGAVAPFAPIAVPHRSRLAPDGGAFTRGRDLECLFRRWRSDDSSTLAHWGMVHSEFWSAFPLPRAFMTLLGRCAATLIREPSDQRPLLAMFTARGDAAAEAVTSFPIASHRTEPAA